MSRACRQFNIRFPQKFWIDSMIDIPFPKGIKTRKLSYLALEHQVPVRYVHRAVFDVQKSVF